MTFDLMARAQAAKALRTAREALEAAGGSGAAHPWYWNPPLQADFAPVPGMSASIAAAMTYSDDEDVGLILSPGAPKTGDFGWGIEKAIPNPDADWSVQAHLRKTDNHAGYMSLGLILRRAGEDQLAVFGHQVNEFVAPVLGISNGGFIDSLMGGNASWERVNEYWLGIDYIAADNNLRLKVSFDGKCWFELTTRSANIITGAKATHIGLGGGMNRSIWTPFMSCDSWHDNWST